MNKKRIALSAVFALLLVAGVVAWLQRPVPFNVNLQLTGTPGLQIAGTVSVDGISWNMTGTLPTDITVRAKSFEYTFYMQEPQGELQAELVVENGPSGSIGTANDFSGVKGHYNYTWGSKSMGVTTARKEE